MDAAMLQKIGVKTLLMLPMIVKGEVIGLVELADSQSERVIGEHEITVAQLLANQAGTAIQNAKLFKRVQRELVEKGRVEKALRSGPGKCLY